MTKDTHGASGEGWIGFDLDGTLAKYDKWEGIDHIGEPVKPMVDRIRSLHAEGKVVKIVTARVAPRSATEVKVSPRPFGPDEMSGCPWRGKSIEWTAREFIQEWCYNNLGFVPEITHEKDHLMLELYDDRVKQVVPNKGILVEDELIEAANVIVKMKKLAHDVLNRAGKQIFRLSERLARNENWFARLVSNTAFGIVIGCLFFGIIMALIDRFGDKTPLEESLDHLQKAIVEVRESLDGEVAIHD